jgi:hypothetical protein
MSKKWVRGEELATGEPSPSTEVDELCRQAWDLIGETEKRLRALMANRCQQEWGKGWHNTLCKRHAALAKEWLDRQTDAKPTLDTYGLPPGTLLDYPTLGELKGVILAEWQLFRDVFQFKKGSGRENKKAVEKYLEWIIEARNPLAHSRSAHPHQLRRAWVACDEIRMQIASWMGENLWLPMEKEGEPERPAIRHFMTLGEYLARPGLRFPKASDFEEELVYLPEEYVSIMRTALEETGRCLLVGRSAAGKTVLAIAFGRQLHETEDCEVFYRDAGRSQEVDGRAWYQEVRANDREGALYILDNCHLALEEANEFCFQWEGTPPKYAQTILISRPRTGESEASSAEIVDYFDMWGDVTVEVQPEVIYCGVIEKYGTAYCRRNPDFYVALQDDDETVLEAQHAHNLVACRSRLETWFETGGRLSQVTQEKMYKVLAQKYLSGASEALTVLCALWQYEIPAHNAFVGKLPEDEMDWLEQENLLTYSIVRGYGLLYQPMFHPDEAREIFEASIYRKWGHIDASRVEAEAVSSLRAYLRAKPSNYVWIYNKLYHQKQDAILRQLLADRDMQTHAASLFAVGRISDTALYLLGLSEIAPSRAQALLDEFTQALGINGIRSRVLAQTLMDIGISLRRIQGVNAELAGKILAGIDMRQLAERVEPSSRQELTPLIIAFQRISPKRAETFLKSIPPQTFAAMLTTASFSSIRNLLDSLQKLGYQSVQLKEIVESIDMEQLAQQAETRSLQALLWLVRALKGISPQQAKNLIESIPLRTLVDTIAEGNLGLNTLGMLFAYLQELDYPAAQLNELIESLDMEQLAQQAKTRSLQKLFWLVRALKDISPETANGLLETITPAGLASLLCSKGATAQALDHFCRVSTRRFRQQFLRQFSVHDIAAIFDRSPLGQVGIVIQYRYPYFIDSYALFRKRFLAEKLATEPLDEIGKFVHRIGQEPEVGHRLACEVLDLLVTVDLSEQIASTDLEQFAVLLHTTNAVSEEYSSQLLDPLRQYEILVEALEKSGVRGIQLLIHNVAGMDEQYLPHIQQALQASDLTDKFPAANVAELGYLLWNVFVHVDQSLSREYCEIIDKQRRSQQLSEASLDDLCRFLWNLTHISNLSRLQTLDDPIIKERLIAAWDSDVGRGAELLGIVSMTWPRVCECVPLPPIKTQAQKEHLASWLVDTVEGRNPYLLALTLRGLRAHHDEAQAQALVGEYLPIPKASPLLEDAKASALTSRSVQLLQETLQWLAELPADSETDEIEDAQ